MGVLAGAQTEKAHPRDAQIHDADTKAWWHTTEALSGDAMEGRDTGSDAYLRAATYVAARFRAAGLKPAGEAGTYMQDVPMFETDVLAEGTSFTAKRASGEVLTFPFLQEITVAASDEFLQAGSGAVTFRGYCGKDAMKDIERKVVVCFGTQRAGLPSAGERAKNAHDGMAMGLITVDDPSFTIEPPRWPAAYARSVVLSPAGGVRLPLGSRLPWPALPGMRLSAAAFARMLAGTGQDAAAILKSGGARQPLASFDVPLTFTAQLHVATKEIHSPNVVAVLPGSDALRRGDYVVVAAHLDGYGYGTPVDGDSLYNGALDDAAYVALLIQMADNIQAGTVARPKRSILFCAFTGEEKGLLGSTWFVQHPTVAKSALVADINLDQLRPLFPLKILTAEAIDESTLGATARTVGAAMGIALREDREPERGLLRRADHYPFLRAGVPAIGFIFGFDAGTDAEARYREWYRVRYHRPQDDLTQPMDFDAAAKFDAFFYKLVLTVTDAAARPAMLAQPQAVLR